MKRSLKSYALLVALSLIWGSSFILMKRGLLAFSPFQIAAIRMVLAGICLSPILLRHLRFRAFTRSEWIAIVLVSLFGNATPAWLFPLAETQLNSATVGVLNVLTPIFVVILGVSFFGMSFRKRQFWGVLLGLVGSVFLITLSKQKIALHTQALYALLVIGAAVCYGFSANLIKLKLSEIPAPLLSAYALGIAAIPYLFPLIGSGFFSIFESHPHAWAAFGYLSILAVLGTAVALVIFNYLVQVTEPVFATSVTYLIPIVALLWGLVDHENISLGQMGSIAVILAGVYMANK